MCTAVNTNRYFGRNLDLDFTYGEKVVVTPKNYPFHFRRENTVDSHYAIIGMAIVNEGYPLYFDAMNEKGLAMAGLRFPEAVYQNKEEEGKHCISPFELIPWILSKCESLEEAKELLKKTCLVKINFSDNMPLSPLHWIISDKGGSITLEATNEGLRIYDNEPEILTNSPSFPFQMINLAHHMNISPEKAKNRISDKLNLTPYCVGLSSVGMPGDYSSLSRFVRASFVKANIDFCEKSEEQISSFFHILSSVSMPKGCVITQTGQKDYTVYSSCCDREKGTYYYKTYSSMQVKSVAFSQAQIENDGLQIF